MSAARRGVRVAFAVIFALLALNAWAQVVLGAMGESSDPPVLLALQFLIGLTAAATTVGIWQGARWSPATALAYGVVTGSMIVALEFILDLGREARAGLWMGGIVIFIFGVLAAWYLQRSLARDGARASPSPD